MHCGGDAAGGGTCVQLETPKLRGPGMSGGTEVLPVLGAHSLLISDPLPPSGESPIPSQCPGVSAEWYVCLMATPHPCLPWKQHFCHCLFCLPASV